MSDSGDPCEPSGEQPGEQEDLHFIVDPILRFDDDVFGLVAALQTIFQTPDRAGADPVTALQARYAVALMRLGEFLRSVGAGDDVARKIATLGRWFVDLQNGNPVPVFQPKKWDGAPRSNAMWYVRALAVVAVECFKKSGMKLPAAQARVAREKDLELALDAGATLVKSLKSWRDTIKSKKKAPPTPAADTYRIAMADFERMLERLSQRLDGRPVPSGAIEKIGESVLQVAIVNAREYLPIENR